MLLLLCFVPCRVFVFAALNLSRKSLASDLRLKVLDTPPLRAVYPAFDLSIRMLLTSFDDGSSSSSVYKPTGSFKDATIYTYNDGILSVARGVYLSMSLSMSAGEVPRLSFTGQGIYVAPLATAFPGSITYPTDAKSAAQSESLTINNGTSFSTGIVRSINFDYTASFGERTNLNSSTGFEGIITNDRNCTMQIVVEADATIESTRDWFADLRASGNGTTHAVTFSHDYSTDSGIQFSAPTAQLTGINWSDDNGVLVYTLDYNVQSETDDGEFTITYKNAA